MKKVFLDELPRWESGTYKGKIKWKDSIGYKVKFIYDDIEGEIEIVDYNTKNRMLTIKYKNKVKSIKSCDFVRCGLGNILGKRTNDFKVEIGDTFKDDKRDITIIDRKIKEVKIENKKYKKGYTIANKKLYKYHCNKDGNEDWIEENNLLKGRGCNVCSGRKALLGVNTIWDKARWMCDLGVSENDAKKYMPCSTEDIYVICPYCKTVKKTKPINIYAAKSIACNCGDGKSYPEKFILNALEQTEECFEVEYSPEYLNNKRNDFYLPQYNIVIEADGCLGHEGGKVHSKSNKTLEECIEVDKWKEEQNLKHGIRTIRINCFESDPDYIKNNILTSELTDYIDFSNVDWNECEKYALKNMVYEVCRYWHEHREINKEDITTKDLCNIFNLSKCVIIRYLKKGTKLLWCNYTGNKNTVIVYDLNMNYIGFGESTIWIDKHSEELFGVHLDFRGISSAATGKIPHYKGFIFKYEKDIDK